MSVTRHDKYVYCYHEPFYIRDSTRGRETLPGAAADGEKDGGTSRIDPQASAANAVDPSAARGRTTDGALLGPPVSHRIIERAYLPPEAVEVGIGPAKQRRICGESGRNERCAG